MEVRRTDGYIDRNAGHAGTAIRIVFNHYYVLCRRTQVVTGAVEAMVQRMNTRHTTPVHPRSADTQVASCLTHTKRVTLAVNMTMVATRQVHAARARAPLFTTRDTTHGFIRLVRQVHA